MIVTFLVKSFLTLFVVIDPIGLAPIFIILANDRTSEERLTIARQAVLFAALILLVFSLIGPALLRYLEISLDAFQVAAGILLFKIAIDMVFTQPEQNNPSVAEENPSQPDITVFPLAIPLIAGPGTLASIVILVGESENYLSGLLMVLAVTAVVLAIAYGILHLSDYLAQILGKAGIDVITRVLGVLLTALAVQYIANGAMGLLQG
ncbi:MAG: MarC family protein [Leptolyngbyaceae cyanobacterium bins.59]|nr:MarC family protein [Leptolyngbyaceae cyanobacterium bins.59]